MLRSVLHPRPLPAALFALLVLALGACATRPTDPAARAEYDETNDPFEPLNRKIFAFNLFFDRILFRPVAVTYDAAVPEVMRNSIRHFLDNLGEPVVFANDMLQGEFKRADTTVGRFLMNSTFGVGGLMDLATKEGLEKQSGDFGQTLYAWGAGDGPYLVLPLFGPSNVRDAFGLGVDVMTTPPALVVTGHSRTLVGVTVGALDGIDLRSRNIETLDEIKASSLDFYAHLKSVTRQHRAGELREARGLEAAPPELVDPNAPPDEP